MRGTALLLFAACGNPTTAMPTTGSAPQPAMPVVATPAPPSCAGPAAACKVQDVRVCKADDPARVGEWRYAIAAPPYSPVETITAARLAALLAGRDPGVMLAASAETQRVLGTALEPLADPPVVDDARWALVPAHELTPAWHVVSIDGAHPLDRAPGPLAVPLCGDDKARPVRNIDPARLTTLAMTGTTALTRYTAKLMEEKGVLYPLQALQAWFTGNDLVHISNEVSFIPDKDCDTGLGTPTMKFCAKDRYIELLEKSQAKIIELTGSHLDDYGAHWIRHSLDLYAKRGWVWFGGGRDEHEASEPRVVEHNGNKLAFIGCNMPHTVNGSIKDQPGTAACDLARIAWQIGDLNRRGHTVIVSVQHDEVYRHDPPPNLVRDLRAIAAAGPAFVMGSQAHCPHPWELHHGAFVHYGPGNLYFDQFWHPVRDAAHDKLYIHAGKLLAVGRLYIRTEERGRPRLLADDERTEFLSDLAAAHARLPAGAEPTAAPNVVPESRDRPDSVVIRGVTEAVNVRAPAKLDPAKQYPAFVELRDREPAARDDAFVITRRTTPRGKNYVAPAPERLVAEITALLKARYPIDLSRTTFELPDPPPAIEKPTKKRTPKR